MKAYWILNYDITNIEGFSPYRAAARPIIMKLVDEGKAKILVINDDVIKDKQEGNPGKSLVMLEFESKEVANEFYYSDEYQKTIKMRTDNSAGWSIIVDERP